MLNATTEQPAPFGVKVKYLIKKKGFFDEGLIQLNNNAETRQDVYLTNNLI